MFSRYLPLAAKKCKKLIFMCQQPLTPLFAENPQLGISELIGTYIPESEMDFDYHAPLLSLPYILGLSGEDVFQHLFGSKDTHTAVVDKRNLGRLAEERDGVRLQIHLEGHKGLWLFSAGRVVGGNKYHSVLNQSPVAHWTDNQ